MGPLEKFQHKSAGYRAVLKSGGVVEMLQERADRVAQAADLVVSVSDPDVYLIADTTVGSGRAGATVIGVPMRLELEDRVLGRAIDAAR